ncbi:DUF6517 family protein [Halosolutus gelatinilyticus]|uniref:DUF6517 family protein n=1 Tax=Halosolutus gelatinilyticus TaxID=2931975 RepID=UPI001FF4F94F|nr:DUF6517 family protein [Halosolutus gelatinilyticus]
MNRRPFVAALATGSIGATAGCFGLFDDATSFVASPAIVDPDRAADAGYEYQGTVERVETREVPRTDETVEATNYISEYTRTIEVGLDVLDENSPEAGAFAVITTPQVQIAGRDFNPVGDMSNAEITERIQSQYEDLTINGSVGTRTVDGLGQSIDVETFAGEAKFLGQQDVDVFVDVAQPDDGDDHLVIVGAYPDDSGLLAGDEEGRIDTMIGGLEHGDDVPVEIVDADER